MLTDWLPGLCSRLSIFLSYSSSDRPLAEKIAQTLRNSGHEVFFDQQSLPTADDYNERTKVTVGREVFGLLGMTLAVVLPTYLTAKLGDSQGYMTLGLIFLPIAVLFSLPTLLWAGPSVHPPVIHAKSNCVSPAETMQTA